MRRLVISMVLFLPACVDTQPTQAPLIDGAVAKAHSPAHRPRPNDIVPVSTPPAYTQLDAATATGTNGSLHLSVTASGPISRFPDSYIQSVAVFGYGWVDGQTGNGIVAVIHPTIGRDSHQSPDGWHTHPVELGTGTTASTFCIISIGGSQGGIAIRDNLLSLNIGARQAGLTASALDVAASFIVAGDNGCPELAPGVRLGVQVLDATTL